MNFVKQTCFSSQSRDLLNDGLYKSYENSELRLANITVIHYVNEEKMNLMNKIVYVYKLMKP